MISNIVLIARVRKEKERLTAIKNKWREGKCVSIETFI